MKPALSSRVDIEFFRPARGTVDPLNETWTLRTTMRDADLREHSYSIVGNDHILLPSVEVLAEALLKLLREGVKD